MNQKSGMSARSSAYLQQALRPLAALASTATTPAVAAIALAFTITALAPAASRATEPRKATTEAIAALVQNPTVPAAGAKNADVTIVEFFDYNCPYCKKTAPELQKFLRTDAKVRVLFKEWPIFGDVSEYAARSALAAHWQGKFLVAHEALFASPTDLDENAQVDDLLKKAGLDMTQLSHDRSTHAAEITAILSRNSKEASSLGFKGTPAFVIGRQLIPQSMTVQTLQQFTQSARQSP
jgi:protein-disulfide isomerase